MADAALTPAGELRAAAAKLREMAARAPKGPWRTERYFWKPRSEAIRDQWMVGVLNAYDHPVAHTSETNDDVTWRAADRMAWIALMGPDKADALADLLDEAGDLAHFADVMAGGSAEESSLPISERAALRFARSILGSS